MSSKILAGPVLLLCCLGAFLAAQAPDGAALYKDNCASCHDSSETHAPLTRVLKQMYPEAVLKSMDDGTMKAMSASLSAAERRAIALWVTGKNFGSAPEFAPAAAMCAGGPKDFPDSLDKNNWNGWSPDQANTRYQPAPGFSAADVPRLKLRWAFGIPGATISNGMPSVVNGRLYVGTASRVVYSLNAKTGCIHWAYEATAGVRSAITIGKPPQLSRYAAFFGDARAFVYAVDAGNGSLIWKTNVESFPSARITGTPKLSGNRLYVPVSILEEGLAINPKYECCKSRASIVALDAATGKEIWRFYTVQEELKRTKKSPAGTQLWGPAGVSIWTSPTLDPEKKSVYVSTGNNHSNPTTRMSDAIVALDMDSGRLLWSRQLTPNDAYNVACVRPDRSNCPDNSGPDFDFGSSPILVKLADGKRALLAGQKSGIMHALDADNGEVIWQTRVGLGGLLGGIQWGSGFDGNLLYVPLSDIAWVGMNVLDPTKGGGLFALRPKTGEKVWSAPPVSCQGRAGCSPAQSAAASVIPGAVFSAAVDGHMRAYSTADGKMIWDFDTAREFETVNKVAAKGGAIDGPGAAIAGGMVYVPSGYGSFGGRPGNVLLAFSVDGK